jgi:xanthine dehydrogenase YagR molybdenum-binding subunit
MADTQYHWPTREKSQVIGKRITKLDGVEKSTGKAKYTYDVNLKNQLIAHALGSPHAHCKIKSIDTSAAEKTKGVVHIELLRRADSEIEWQGELIAVVAAESEAAAAEGVANLKVEYELLDVFVRDDDLAEAERLGRTASGGGRVETQEEPDDDEDEDEFVEKELERLFKESKTVVEADYGIDAITHCCLEPHGSTVSWEDGKLLAYLSTQNVSGTDDGFARDLEITADDVEVRCEHIGGGFGSKFAPDYWGIAAARISKATGRPVKFMLSRAQELQLGGNRPSAYLKVKVGADENGVIQVWDSHHWGTAGISGGAVSQTVIPYVLVPKNYRRRATNVNVNAVRSRAWRAPNHPQACAITQTVIDDVARIMKKDSLEVFLANLVNADNGKEEVYRDQLRIAAELIGWKEHAHLHGEGTPRGSIVSGLGIGLHTWGGVANSSRCNLKIRQDGSVESECGTQDLGTGTRTICAMVLAETFGLQPDEVTVRIGSSKYPESGASGGSTTVGAVTESHRRAAQDALAKIFRSRGTPSGNRCFHLGSRRRKDPSGGRSLSRHELEGSLPADRHAGPGSDRQSRAGNAQPLVQRRGRWRADRPCRSRSRNGRGPHEEVRRGPGSRAGRQSDDVREPDLRSHLHGNRRSAVRAADPRSRDGGLRQRRTGRLQARSTRRYRRNRGASLRAG